MKQILLLIVFFIFTGFDAYTQSSMLSVRVSNINLIQGELQISIYNDSESFLRIGEEYKIYRFKITKSDDKFIVSDLPKGEYALIIYHDKNNNGEMYRTFFGIPKE